MFQENLFKEEKNYIMSIKEGSANAIFNNLKPHEFRRRFDSYQGKARIFLYVTKPTAKIMGEIICETPIIGSIDKMIELLSENKYDTENTLRNYLSNSKESFALPIISTCRYENSIPLSEMRNLFPNFFPPMSSQRLDSEKYKNILEFLLNRK